MKKRFIFPAAILAIFFLGPKEHYSDFDAIIEPVSYTLEELDSVIAQKDQNVPNLKSNNQSRFFWADSIRKTPYAVVYLHGFSASPMEGYPTHENFAKRFGCNIYIPRLPQHGLNDKESFVDLEPKDLIDAAKEALSIGQLIGEKVILMSCSTGSTLSIYLTAHNPELVDAMIMYSPNIDLENKTSELVTLPWGKQIVRSVIGKYRYAYRDSTLEKAKYTTNVYRTEGVICLKEMIEQTMIDEVFQKINCPYFLGYYYKNENEKDPVVSVDQMLYFDKMSSTAPNNKRLVPFPNVNTHVIPSGIHSQDIESVQNATYSFAEEILGMVPIQKDSTKMN